MNDEQKIQRLRSALERAERFIIGFEDDDDQAPEVPALLEEIRGALRDVPAEMTEREHSMYWEGFDAGITAYAHYGQEGGGVQYVGTAGRTLREAREKIGKTWNFQPGAAFDRVKAAHP